MMGTVLVGAWIGVPVAFCFFLSNAEGVGTLVSWLLVRLLPEVGGGRSLEEGDEGVEGGMMNKRGVGCTWEKDGFGKKVGRYRGLKK
jgi:hypothetical protein